LPVTPIPRVTANDGGYDVIGDFRPDGAPLPFTFSTKGVGLPERQTFFCPSVGSVSGPAGAGALFELHGMGGVTPPAI